MLDNTKNSLLFIVGHHQRQFKILLSFYVLSFICYSAVHILGDSLIGARWNLSNFNKHKKTENIILKHESKISNIFLSFLVGRLEIRKNKLFIKSHYIIKIFIFILF